jgi:hypothetical protein
MIVLKHKGMRRAWQLHTGNAITLKVPSAKGMRHVFDFHILPEA